jgi:hypothetical protein
VATEHPRTDLGDHWQIEEDDYGDPMVFHRHLIEEVPAYIISGLANRRLAQCSECQQYLEFLETSGDPRYELAHRVRSRSAGGTKEPAADYWGEK